MHEESEFMARDWEIQPPALATGYKSSVSRAPRLPLVCPDPSLSERTGPRFSPEDLGPLDNDLLRNFSAGEAVPIGQRTLIHGHVRDETGRPLEAVLIEIWQANASGRYRHQNDGYRAPLDPAFGGCGRTLSDKDGYYCFRTIRPGAYPWRNFANSWRPAHIHFSLIGGAIAQRLISQMYFEGDPLIGLCPIVQAIPNDEAIDRLIARLDLNATRPFDTLAYRFDIVLRGRRATPFEFGS